MHIPVDKTAHIEKTKIKLDFQRGFSCTYNESGTIIMKKVSGRVSSDTLKV